MAFLPITLGVRRGQAAAGRPGPKSRKDTEKALLNDGYCCRFCGFHSRLYQRVLVNNDPKIKDQLLTTCLFCEQCLTLERASVTGAGTLVWLPEISQVELNHIIRAIYVAKRKEDGPMAATASRALETLTSRRSEAKKRLGSDDPLLLATVMQEALSNAEYKATEKKLDGVRLIPSQRYMIPGPQGHVDQMPKIIDYWLSPEGPFAKMQTDHWVEMFNTASSKVGHA